MFKLGSEQIFLCTCVCMYVDVCVRVSVCLYVCLSVYVFYIYINMQKYINIIIRYKEQSRKQSEHYFLLRFIFKNDFVLRSGAIKWLTMLSWRPNLSVSFVHPLVGKIFRFLIRFFIRLAQIRYRLLLINPCFL